MAFLVLSAFAQSPEGSIRGTVVADDGSPVSDAHVYSEVMQGSKILTVLTTNTDALGVFTFSGLARGEYRVSAEKQESGYLSTRPDIFACGPPLALVITPDTPTATTLIRFGPKAGVITGWVRDSATAKSIAAQLSLAPVSGCGWSSTGTSGRFKFRLLIPADTAVNFGACAVGYKSWFYADPSNPSRPLPLQLRPGSELEIDIKLERSAENSQTPCSSGRF
jgi:hypothetical protein